MSRRDEDALEGSSSRRRGAPLALLLLLAGNAQIEAASTRAQQQHRVTAYLQPNVGGSRRVWGVNTAAPRSAIMKARLHRRAQCAAPRKGSAQFRTVLSAVASPPATAVDDFPQLLEALSAYKREHGDVAVPPQYVVPEGGGEAQYPEDVWGMRLGSRVAKLRDERENFIEMHPARYRLLRSMGLDFASDFVDPAAYEEDSVPEKIAYGGFSNDQRSAKASAQDKDFEDVVDALVLYKQITGDMQVSPQWKVPETDQWPERLWNLPLGLRCSGIRSRNMYVQDHPQRQAKLTSIGFEFNNTHQATETKFLKLYTALMLYRDLNNGSVDVPATFVVPANDQWPPEWHNLKLGASLNSIRTNGTYIKGQPARKALLEGLGFSLDDSTLAKAKKQVLRRTKAQVASDKEAEAEAEAAAAADEEQAAVSSSDEQGGESSLLQTLAAAAGSSAADSVSSSTTSSSSSSSSTDSSPFMDGAGGLSASDSPFGQGLGSSEDAAQSLLDSLVASIKDEQNLAAANKAAKKAAAPPTGPIGRSSKHFMDEEELIAQLDDQIIFDMPPLPDSIIPMATWPQVYGVTAARRMMGALGTTVMGGKGVVSGQNAFSAGRGNLFTAAAEAAANNAAAAGAAAAATAAAATAAANGEMFLEEGSDPYSQGSFVGRGGGGNLKTRAIPRGVGTADMNWMTDEDRLAVARHGFHWDEFGDGFDFEQVLQALTHYQKLYGSLDMPPDFEVPYDYEWPRDLAEMRLGTICDQMRCGDIYARASDERKAALDEIGFPWREKHGEADDFLLFQYDEVLCALYSFYMLRGDMFMDADFVIPDEAPWPLPLRGMPLGFLVNVIRLQKDVLHRHYPERFRMIDSMEFVWMEPEFKDWEDIEVHGVGNGVPLPGPFDDIYKQQRRQQRLDEAELE